MTERRRENQWLSLHTDYLQFAYESHRASQIAGASTAIEPFSFVKRSVIETIRYSFDCLDATLNFVYEMGRLKQLPVQAPDTWLTRHMERNWSGMSVAERIGMLTYAWIGEAFWETKERFGLFNDLRRIRGGLTHPEPFGEIREYEVVAAESLPGGIKSETRNYVEQRNLLKPKLLVAPNENEQVARFHAQPTELDPTDGEKALEILLCHLCRMEALFFGRPTTEIAMYFLETNSIESPRQLLGRLNRHFQNVWPV